MALMGIGCSPAAAPDPAPTPQSAGVEATESWTTPEPQAPAVRDDDREADEVRVSELDCSGTLDAASAVTVIRAAVAEFRTCYELELRRDRELAGRARVAILVGSTGAVEDVDVQGDLTASSFVECVRRAAMPLQFAAPEGGDCVVVVAPLDLRPLERP
jgi:hypothetical protein